MDFASDWILQPVQIYTSKAAGIHSKILNHSCHIFMIVNMPADLLYFCLGQPTHFKFCERLDSPAHFDFCEGWLDSPAHFDFCEGLDSPTHFDFARDWILQPISILAMEIINASLLLAFWIAGRLECLQLCSNGGGGPSDSVTPRPAPYGSLFAWLVACKLQSYVWTMVVEYNIAWISGNEDYCVGRAASALAGRDNWIQFNVLHYGPLVLILNKQDQLKSQVRDRQG